MISSLELARLCGVSQGTVDRALHNRKGVSDATREKILAAAAEHGYQPNPAAREIMTGRSAIVGAHIPEGHSVFFLDLFHAIGRRLREQGLRLLLAPYADDDDLVANLEDFAARRAHACLLIPPRDGFVAPPPVESALPLLALVSPAGGGAVNLLPDEVAMGRTAADFLLQHGHRRLLLLTYARNAYAIQARREGFTQALRAQGETPHVLPDFSPEALVETIRGDGITAIFCHNDWLALQAVRTLRQAGLRVPEDVAVLGVDNSPSFHALCDELTTLAYPTGWAAAAVAAVLAGHDVPPCPAPEVVLRRTV